MSLTKIITIICFSISIYLSYYLYGSIQSTIDSRKLISVKETAVIEKLKLIRDAEVLFQGFYGRYTDNWDSLIHFVQYGKIPITERREEIIQKEYGGEDVIVHIDTLGFISAWEQIFKDKFTMNATENGIFMGFRVKLGDRAIKNQRAYSLKIEDKIIAPPFSEEGTISSLADIKVGKSVTKDQLLVSFWNNRFDPNTDISRMAYKPGIEDIKFDIFVGTVDKNGVLVDIIEVRDPLPYNIERNESNKLNTRKPLRFGSRTDVFTSGNWE